MWVRSAYKLPSMNTTMSADFLELDRRKPDKIGMGMQRTKTSRNRFVISYPRRKCGVLLQ